MKTCRACGETKPLEAFGPEPRVKDGRQARCHTCETSRKAADPNIHQAKAKASRRRYARLAATPQGRTQLRTESRAASQRYRSNPATKQRQAARAALNHQIRIGTIKRQPCEVCGAPEAEAHHADYSAPLVVRWLCKLHHEAVHHA